MAILFNLKGLLEKKKVSQTELSRVTEIRFPTISAMCNNSIKNISIENLQKICDYLDCQPGDFIENVTLTNVKKRRMLMSREYSIPVTTKEERKKQVSNAIALSTLDAPEPSKETLLLFEEYIDGKINQEEILEETIERYAQINEDQIYEVTLKKEVLLEFTAEILADFARYFIKNDIDETEEKEDLLVQYYWNIVNLRNRITGSKYYNSLDDLIEVEKTLKAAKEKIVEMED